MAINTNEELEQVEVEVEKPTPKATKNKKETKVKLEAVANIMYDEFFTKIGTKFEVDTKLADELVEKGLAKKI
jgi:hypothetical protein